MNGLRIMPLKFRIWDKVGEHFLLRRFPEGVCIEYSIFELPVDIDCLDEDEKNNFIISQDTGLKDKNGKSIYIGDIVDLTKAEYDPIDKIDHYRVYIAPVVYENGHSSLRIERPECVGGAYWVLLGSQKQEELEIIGNVWENPELLEEK